MGHGPSTGPEPESPCNVATMPAEPEEDGVDVTLIRWMLSLSPEERLAVLQGFVDSIAALIDDPPNA